ncbi:hypothetical protein CVIRNUC_007966 [Coccomyxa viridis]|uniref:BRO1 domain-containing protein n=1 Tax=Coccomyxa viridis TaxID=1274662 RepID=A0AAV1IDH1_9CHLO|nr:hypothetical protein CVIRNUC_007966 [Coccomyxa viridis]
MEAVAEQRPDATSDRTSTAGAGTASDRLRVHAHLYKPRLKTSDAAPDFQAELRQYASRQGRNAAVEYATALGSARRAFVIKAETPVTSDVEAALDEATKEYISLLVGLINALPKQKRQAESSTAKQEDEAEELAAGMEPSAQGADDTGDAAHKGAASSGAAGPMPSSSPADGKAVPDVRGDSKLRRGAVAFEWKDVMITPPTSVAARDAVYELGCVLEAMALWKMARAAQLCAGSRQGTPSESVSQAYRLLRAAAGMFDFVRDHCASFLINAVDTKDCNVQTAQAFSLACIAEAQALTVLRAVQKGNAPSLVASLATDASAAFKSAAGTAGGVVISAKAESKFLLFADYQAKAMEALSQAFAGQEALTSQQAGTALAYLGSAKSQLAAAQGASKAYDRAQPVTSATEHEYADLELKQTIEKQHDRAERDNKSVYFQHIPAADTLAQTQPRRLVTATACVLPAPADLVNEALMESFAEVPPDKANKMSGVPAASATAAGKTEDSKPDEEPGKPQPKGGAWWQWLLVIVAMPFLAIISLVGAIVWVILLPVKCFCCPLGCAAQLLWSAVEWLLKAPFRALLWASGKPWKPEKPEELKQGGAKTKAGEGKKPDKDKTPPV